MGANRASRLLSRHVFAGHPPAGRAADALRHLHAALQLRGARVAARGSNETAFDMNLPVLSRAHHDKGPLLEFSFWKYSKICR